MRKGRDALSLASALTVESCGQLHGVKQRRPATPSGKPVIPEELDSWLSIGGDGKVTVCTGRIDMGTGVETAFGRRISDELDVPFESVKIVMGDTELTPDQGKSTARQQRLRRRSTSANGRGRKLAGLLLKMAADRFSVSVDELEVADGIVRVRSAPSKQILYTELVGGRGFRTRLDQKTGKAVLGACRRTRRTGR